MAARPRSCYFRRTMRTIPLLGLALLVSAAQGAEPPDPTDSSLVAAIRRLKPADYPSANSVLVLEQQSVVYQADGQFANTMRTVRLVLPPARKQAAAAAPLAYAQDP